MSKQIIISRLEELITLCQTEGMMHTSASLCAITGAIYSDDETLLASHINDFVKEVLFPKAKNAVAIEKLIKGDDKS